MNFTTLTVLGDDEPAQLEECIAAEDFKIEQI